MTWTKQVQDEIDRLLDEQDLSEVFTKAVSTIIEGRVDRLAVSLGQSCGCDPGQTIDFGERLLVACVDKIRGK